MARGRPDRFIPQSGFSFGGKHRESDIHSMIGTHTRAHSFALLSRIWRVLDSLSELASVFRMLLFQPASSLFALSIWQMNTIVFTLQRKNGERIRSFFEEICMAKCTPCLSTKEHFVSLIKICWQTYVTLREIIAKRFSANHFKEFAFKSHHFEPW